MKKKVKKKILIYKIITLILIIISIIFVIFLFNNNSYESIINLDDLKNFITGKVAINPDCPPACIIGSYCSGSYAIKCTSPGDNGCPTKKASEYCPNGCFNGICILAGCTPSCSGKTCGSSNGCGETCKPGSGCSGNCIPNCAEKKCGDDNGCGGWCYIWCPPPDWFDKSLAKSSCFKYNYDAYGRKLGAICTKDGCDYSKNINPSACNKLSGTFCNPKTALCGECTCIPSNSCKKAKCSSTGICTETNKLDGTKCELSPSESPSSSLSSISPFSSFLKLFGLELAITQDNQGICKKGECIECTSTKRCPKNKKELVCKDNGIYERTSSYKCEKGKCVASVLSEVLKQDCNQKIITGYNCRCVHDTPPNQIDKKDYYSVCTTTKVVSGLCLDKYPGVDKNEPHCSLTETNDEKWLRCGSTTDLGAVFSNCDDNVHSPDFGHCKDNCNPKCDSECQYCFTWLGEGKCYNLPDEKTCKLSTAGYGQCKSGRCELSKCNPVPRECEFCGYSKIQGKYIAAADTRKNGMDCTDDGKFAKGTAFCWNGECIEKNCENIGDSKCGNPASSSFQTCCNSKTETCCGNQNSAFCCNKETETCAKALNVNGYQKTQENLKKTIAYLKELIAKSVKENNYKDSSQITPTRWAAIWIKIFNYYNKLQKNTKYDETDDFFSYCATKISECEEQGKKICAGTHGSSCCPKTGQGSTCITYQIIDPAFLPDIDLLLLGIPEGYAKEMLKILIKEKTPTYGLCGDAACPIGTTQCSGNSINIFNNGVLCCKNDAEICNPRPTSWDSKNSLVPLPREVVTEFPPRCEPAIYCGKGYTTCKLTEKSIADTIFRSKKLCCKIGSEICFTEPSISYARCVPLPKK